MHIEVNVRFIMAIFVMELIAYAILAKAGFKLNEVPEVIIDALRKIIDWFRQDEH